MSAASTPGGDGVPDLVKIAARPNRVELFREPGKSLGISIVGGRGMGSRLNNGEVMRGIFIKHILEDSPAGQDGTLKTGDRIVEVSVQTGLSIQEILSWTS